MRKKYSSIIFMLGLLMPFFCTVLMLVATKLFGLELKVSLLQGIYFGVMAGIILIVIAKILQIRARRPAYKEQK